MPDMPGPREVLVLPDLGGWISGASAGVPRAACGRCEDWTTVIHRGNVISPCPACRPEEYDAWLADGNVIPDRGTAA